LTQPLPTQPQLTKGINNMASLNLTQFIGNVGSIETRYLPSGEAVCNIAIAVNDKYKNKAGEMVEHTEWVRIVFFQKLAEIATQYVKKGDPLYVSGQMRTRKYQNKEGVDVYSTEIRGDRLQMLGSKPEGAAPSAPRQAAGRSNQQAESCGGASGFDDMDDDIPFN
jgi:single-strand DNA-binding protein